MLCEIMEGMVIVATTRTYSEMLKLKTYEDRFNYLKLNGKVGEVTFGSDRILNQLLYNGDPDWKRVRNEAIIRDNGCDLGIEGREIQGPVLVHHINPITVDDVINRAPKVFDLNNLVCTSKLTHNAIHYSNESILIKDPVERRANDTCPWKN